MRVGYGTTVLSKCLSSGGVDGIGSYTRELAAGLSRVAEGMSIIPFGFGHVLDGQLIGNTLSGLDLGRYPLNALMGALTPCYFSGERKLRGKIDLIHATDHLVPKFSTLPVVATLMDAIPLSHPEWVRMNFASLKRWLWRRAASWADHVITISEFSKQEIVKYFGIDPENISVTYLGVDARFFDEINSEVRKAVIARLGLPDQFFLFVGTLQPRKNLSRVLEAHASLPAEVKRNFPLVVVGRAGWGCDELVDRLRHPDQDNAVRWLQYLPDLEVRALMQTGSALVFPSLCEGFGLPVVEAFASRLPVITSNSTSLPEVAGGAALLVDPNSVSEIARAMRQIIEVPGLSERLVAAGLRRAREFSWDACAYATQAIYEKVLAR